LLLTLGRMNRALLSFVTVLGLGAIAAGCKEQDEHAQLDATMKSDGYALFAVDNNRQQSNDVSVKIKDAEPGQTYVLIYSNDPPESSGWFQFDVDSRSRCGGDVGPHCEIPGGFGYMVDYIKVPAGDAPTEIQLRDERCGCDETHDSKSWTGHWAVMRVNRTNKEDQLTVDVWAKTVKTINTKPEISQLL